MIREPYIGMPIFIGGNPGHRPGDDTCSGGACPPSPMPSTPSNPSQPSQPSRPSRPGSGTGSTGSGSTGAGSNQGNTGGNQGNTGSNQGSTIDNTGGRNYDARLLGSLPLAMAYTPMQQWKTTYSRDVALEIGTVFPELDLPFEGGTRR